MAHELNYNKKRGTYSFFSKNEVAWHGLGQVIDGITDPKEALKQANLDYIVASAPLYAHVGDEITSLAENNQGIIRTDTNEVLGVTGNKYTIVQNEESIQFIYDILKLNPDIKDRNEIIIETAGALGRGERIFVSAKLPKNFHVGQENADRNGNGTELYVVFVNSHDGTTSLRAIVTPIRVVCNNTLSAALGSNVASVAFRHTKSINESLKQGSELLGISYKAFNDIKQLHTAMLGVKVNNKQVNDLINQVFLTNTQLAALQTTSNGFIESVSDELISTRTKNRVYDVRKCVDGGVGQDVNRGSLYWAYMGISTFLNNGINYKDYNHKFDALTTGSSILKDKKTLELCADMI